jgi:hypothetical protein
VSWLRRLLGVDGTDAAERTLRDFIRMLTDVRLEAACAQARLELARERGVDEHTLARLAEDAYVATETASGFDAEWENALRFLKSQGVDLGHVDPPRPDPAEARAQVEAEAHPSWYAAGRRGR